MRILVAYDGSASADSAIENMRRAGLPKEAEALVLCVATGEDFGEAEALAAAASQRLRSYFPQWDVSGRALSGAPAAVILEAAGLWHPDLIVAGSHGRSSVARLFLGSVSVELVHRAPCPVRVSRAAGPAGGGPVRIVAGNDGSAEAEAAIRAIAKRSWPEKTEVCVVSVVQTLVPVPIELDASTFAREPAFTVISEADAREKSRLHGVVENSAAVLQKAGLSVTAAVVDGDPRDALIAAAEHLNADVIFVGARGLGRMERILLGSISTHVLTHARCTVEIVH